MRITRSLASIALIAIATATASAQQRPPIRQLGAVSSKSTEVLGGVQGVRQLPDGRVIVNDVPKRRVLLFDPSLSTFTVIADSTSATANAYSGRIGGLIPFKGDSSIFVDPFALSMLVIDGSGKVARVMSVPRSQDAIAFATGAMIDPSGRLIYRASNLPNLAGRNIVTSPGAFTPPDIPDSAAIVRIDLATRNLDTLGWIKTQKIKFDIARDDNGMRITSQTNPLPTVDDWAVLNDGTVAFVRGQDYHVDFVGPDGKKFSATKVPFDWQRLTDEDKVAFLDSLKAVRARMGANAPNIGFGGAGGGGGGGPQIVIAGGAGPGGGGPPPGGAAGGGGNVRIGGGPGGNINAQTNFVPASELPDYKPPFFANSTRADNDGNLWIRTIPTKAIPGGPVYDVINRKGEIVERVQIPENRTIVGFGSDGTVYLANRVDTSVYLEKAKIK